jgi:alkylation response protein AidB-like acyl-CoA dehydrogenase
MLVLTEDEALLGRSAREVIEAEVPVARFRAMRDRGEVVDHALWARLVELGWTGIAVPEDRGGLGLGLAGAAVVLEELGRGHVATPLASSVAAAAVIPGDDLVAGRVAALAWREHPRRAALTASTTRLRDGRLVGRKLAVADAGAADDLLVTADDGGRTVLVRVARADARLVPLARLDHRDAADVVLEGAPGEVVGDLGHVRRLLLASGVALAAEALGGAQGVFDRTRAWLHERHQFGVPLGSFQALQHRMVDVYVQLELTRSAVMQAARVPEPTWVALACAKAGETFLHAAKEAVQLHGGIGMTDEHDVGFWLKRAVVLDHELAALAEALEPGRSEPV